MRMSRDGVQALGSGDSEGFAIFHRDLLEHHSRSLRRTWPPHAIFVSHLTSAPRCLRFRDPSLSLEHHFLSLLYSPTLIGDLFRLSLVPFRSVPCRVGLIILFSRRNPSDAARLTSPHLTSPLHAAGIRVPWIRERASTFGTMLLTPAKYPDISVYRRAQPFQRTRLFDRGLAKVTLELRAHHFA